MHEAAPVNPWVALAYLVAGICFILALRGLSSPASSRRGNRFGMFGMALAVITTLVTHIPVSYTHLDVYKRQGIHRSGRTASAAVRWRA